MLFRSAPEKPVLSWEAGTLLLSGVPENQLPPNYTFDTRVGKARALARHYASTILHFQALSQEIDDRARSYRKLERKHLSQRTARDYQEEAVQRWKSARWQGVVVLPTGAGKSYVAERCIADTKRSALIVVPTLDLLSQWYGGMRAAFGDPKIGRAHV